MSNNPSNEDEFQEMLKRLVNGEGELDPAKLAEAAGLANDPASVAKLMNMLNQAMNAQSDGFDWGVSEQSAQQIAAGGDRQVTDEERAAFEQASRVAELWLDEVTAFGTAGESVRLMTRRQWVDATLPAWTGFAEPVGTNIARALTDVLKSETSGELGELLQGAEGPLKAMGHTMFALQLGSVVGTLGTQVISGGDVSMPVLPLGQPGVVVPNLAAFASEIDVNQDELRLYLLLRELAYARLFQHARWLGLHVESAIRSFAADIHIDVERVQDLAEGFDPNDTEALRKMVGDGSLIPPRTEAQERALQRIEHVIALMEGWVETVANEAAARLPSAASLSEIFRRRRASGAPAERAFAALVGLELRPRRAREAAALWAAVTTEHGIEKREAIWSHPDRMPLEVDLDDSTLFVRGLHEDAPAIAPDALDEELKQLLDDETD